MSTRPAPAELLELRGDVVTEDRRDFSVVESSGRQPCLEIVLEWEHESKPEPGERITQVPMP